MFLMTSVPVMLLIGPVFMIFLTRHFLNEHNHLV